MGEYKRSRSWVCRGLDHLGGWGMWQNVGPQNRRSSEELVLPPHHGPFLHLNEIWAFVEGYLHGIYVTGGGIQWTRMEAPRIILIDLGIRLAVKNDLVSRWMVRYSLSVNRVF
jgi:hypothetical protein